MTDTASILNSRKITLADAAELLAAYQGIGEALAGIAAKRERTHRDVTIRAFTAADIVHTWSADLTTVLVGRLFYEASGMTQFGRTSVCIDKRSGQLTVSAW